MALSYVPLVLIAVDLPFQPCPLYCKRHICMELSYVSFDFMRPSYIIIPFQPHDMAKDRHMSIMVRILKFSIATQKCPYNISNAQGSPIMLGVYVLALLLSNLRTLTQKNYIS